MHLGNKTVNNLVEILVSLQKFYGWFHGGGFRTYHVGSVENEVTSPSVENEVTSPSCIQAGILAPTNNTTKATQKISTNLSVVIIGKIVGSKKIKCFLKLLLLL